MTASAELLEERLRLAREHAEVCDDLVAGILDAELEIIEGRAYGEAWKGLAKAILGGQSFAELVVYVHIPFCSSKCHYCICSSTALRQRGDLEAYLQGLSSEITTMGTALSGVPISALHVGGGSPSLLRPAELDGLFETLERAFELRPNQRGTCHLGVELLPRDATPEKLNILAQRGVHRVSLGVQSLSHAVLQNVSRSFQKTEQIKAAVGAAHRAGIAAVNIDILAGLPGETPETFAATIEACLDSGADALNVSRFLAESTPVSEVGYAMTREDSELASRLLLLADRIVHERRPPVSPKEPLAVAGYGTSYRFIDRPGLANVYEQRKGGPSSFLGLGVGAASHLHGVMYAACASSFDEYIEETTQGKLPRYRVRRLTPRFEMAIHMARRLTSGEVSAREFTRVFSTDLLDAFGDEIKYLVEQGVLRREGEIYRLNRESGYGGHHLLPFFTDSQTQLQLKVARAQAQDRVRHDASSSTSNVIIDLETSEGPPFDEIEQLRSAIAARGSTAVGGARTTAIVRRSSSGTEVLLEALQAIASIGMGCILELAEPLDGETACRVVDIVRTTKMSLEVRRLFESSTPQHELVGGNVPFELIISLLIKRIVEGG